jgi:hypothetical protein
MNVDSMIDRTLYGLRARLSEVLAVPAAAITPDQHLDALVPREERRRVWQEMAEAGYELPPLELSGLVFWLTAVFVVFPLLLVGVILKTWAVVFSLPELGLLARRITRPLAIDTPTGLTVYEVAVALTPFARVDYKAGLWPAKAIADKVRLIIAAGAGVPFDEVRPDTRLADLIEVE